MVSNSFFSLSSHKELKRSKSRMKLPTGTFLQGGKYRLEKCLGQGGFGITYLATQIGLNRKVAIKEFFMADYCEREESTFRMTVPTKNNRDFVSHFLAKFIKEAQNIAALNHPNIIRIHDIFEENETAYYVMEYHPEGSPRCGIKNLFLHCVFGGRHST